jgi:hypothetical protein
MAILKDYRYAPTAVQTLLIEDLLHSVSGKFIKVNELKLEGPFLNHIYEIIVMTQNKIGEHFPKEDPDCYEPSVEEQTASTQFDVDLLTALMSNWSLSYRLLRLAKSKNPTN